ncbi:MAG: lactate racemase domain-containing protein [Planctomycetaceae bacterium]
MPYGTTGNVRLQIPTENVVSSFSAPDSCLNLKTEIEQALEEPLDFPPFSSCMIPDDRLVIVLDPETPQALVLVETVCELALKKGLKPDHISVLLPAYSPANLIEELQSHLRKTCQVEIQVTEHDANLPNGGSYLASSSTSDRIYLDPAIIDADLILPIGQIAFAPLLGYKGNFSTLYPGMSSAEAIKKSHGQANVELEPEDERHLHQLVEEIGWLLGIQFTLQVVASAQGGIAQVLAGAPDSVMRKGKELLEKFWTVRVPDRLETIVISVDQASSGAAGWREVCAAIETGRKLVEHGGRIIVLSQLKEAPGTGINQLARSEFPTDVMRALRETMPEDVIPASQLARALDWARVYLLSSLEGDLLEDLFMIPVKDETALERLLETELGTTAVIPSAQNVHGYVSDD